MTARQPRTPQEAAMLDPTGLMSFPRNAPGGLFGAQGRRRMPFQIGVGGMNYGADQTAPGMDMASPPPISSAPPPPANWQEMVGPETLAAAASSLAGGQRQAPLQVDALPPAPPRRRSGLFGSSASAGMPVSPTPLSAPAQAAGIGAGMQRGAMNMAGALGDAAPPKKGGFDWRMAAGILGDMLGGLNGQAPIFAQNMWKMRQDREQHNQRMRETQAEWNYRNNQPDYSTVGNRRFSYNPGTGEAKTLFVAPTEAEDYARALGAEPGTPEFDTYMQDYILRHSGPTATDNAMSEEDNRQGNRVDLEGVRQGNRVSLEGVRQNNRQQLRTTPTYRDTHPRPRATSSGGKGGGAGGKAPLREGQVIRGPGGQRAIVSGGKLVPL